MLCNTPGLYSYTWSITVFFFVFAFYLFLSVYHFSLTVFNWHFLLYYSINRGLCLSGFHCALNLHQYKCYIHTFSLNPFLLIQQFYCTLYKFYSSFFFKTFFYIILVLLGAVVVDICSWCCSSLLPVVNFLLPSWKLSRAPWCCRKVAPWSPHPRLEWLVQKRICSQGGAIQSPFFLCESVITKNF